MLIIFLQVPHRFKAKALRTFHRPETSFCPWSCFGWSFSFISTTNITFGKFGFPEEHINGVSHRPGWGGSTHALPLTSAWSTSHCPCGFLVCTEIEMSVLCADNTAKKMINMYFSIVISLSPPHCLIQWLWPASYCIYLYSRFHNEIIFVILQGMLKNSLRSSACFRRMFRTRQRGGNTWNKFELIHHSGTTLHHITQTDWYSHQQHLGLRDVSGCVHQDINTYKNERTNS